MSGVDSVEDYQKVLRTITYDNNADAPNNGDPPLDQNSPGEVLIFVQANDEFRAGVASSYILLPPVLSIVDNEATKPAAEDSTIPMQFTVTLDETSTSPVTVHYETEDGTAESGVDYKEKSGDLTIPAGEDSGTITISILASSSDDQEPDKTFTIKLSEPSNAILKDDEATGTIHTSDTDSDDDPNNDEGDNCGCGVDSSDMTAEADSDLDATAATGSLSLDQPLVAGSLSGAATAVYQSDDNPHPIVALSEAVPTAAAGTVAYSADATLTFGGITLPTQYYASSAGLAQGSYIKLAQEFDAAALSTGTYLWSMTVNYHFNASGGGSAQTVTEAYSGQQAIINHIASPYGNRWWISSLDQLIPQAGSSTQPAGITYVSGDGQAAFYPYDSSWGGYDTPHGYYTNLMKNTDGSFTLTDPQGNKKYFTAAGQLTGTSQPDGNDTKYAYNGNGSLSGITDNYGHTVSFGYTSGLLSSVTDAANNVTSVHIDSATNTLTQVTTPPPQSGGSAIVSTMSYDPTSKLIGSLTQVTAGISTQTNYGFDSSTNRLSYIQHADDNTKEQIMPGVVSGLLAPGTGTSSANAAAFVTNTNRTATITDELGHTSTEIFNAHGLVLSETDFNGNTTSYTRDFNGRILTKTTTAPNNDQGLTTLVTTYTYDDKGNVIEVQYPDGSTEHWDYDPVLNVPTTHIDQLGHETDYTIAPITGLVLTVHEIGTGTNDRTTIYTYTPAPTSPGQLPGGLMLTETDPLGILTTYSYYSNAAQPGKFGQVETINYAVGTADHASVSYDYDAAGNMTTSTDELGRVTTYQYDAQNQLIHTALPNPGFSQATASASTTYDGSGRVLTQTDALNNTTQYVYDARGNLWKTIETDPNGGTLQTTYTYDSSGNLKTVTDPLGRVTKYDYDPMGNLLDVIAPDPNGNPSVNGPETSYTYDAAGNRKTMTDPNGGLTTYYYDAMNRLVKEVDPNPLTGLDDTGSQVTTYTYDAAGNMTSMTNAEGQTTYQYDTEGQLVRTIMPNPVNGLGPIGGLNGTPATGTPYTAYTYDNDGNVSTTTDAMGNTTTYEYDYRNRLTWTIEPDPGTGLGGNDSSDNPKTENIYDAAGQLIQSVDQLGQITTYQYDGLGRVHEEIMPNTGDGSGPVDAEGNRSPYADPTIGYPYTVYTYDAAGDELTQTDSLGNTTSYQYDTLGRLTKETQPIPTDDGTDADRPVTQYVYDKDSERIETIDPLGHVTTDQYDGDGRLSREIAPNPTTGLGPSAGPSGSPDAGTAYTAYTYDANGNLKTQADALGDTTTYVYDHLNRQTSVEDPDHNVTNYTYYAWGQQKTITDPDLNTTTYTYDHDGRTLTDTNQLSNARSYTYDADGNVKSEIDRDGRTTTYQYDRLNREIAEDWYAAGSSTAYYTIGYLYRDDGAMLSATAMTVGSATADANYDYEYDGDDHLVQTTSNLAGLTGGVQIGQFYDDNGNLVSLQGASINGVLDFFNDYSYDHLNRLTQIYQFGLAGLFGLPGNTVANKAVNIGYNGLGQIDEIDRYSDAFSTSVANSTYTYNGADQLTGLLDTGPTGATIENYGWHFNAANQISQFVNAKHGNESLTYSYDAAGQLVNANSSGIAAVGYDYDQNGNRTDTTSQVIFGGTTTTAYTTITNNEVTNDGKYAYSYDAEGNTTQRTALDASGNPTGETFVLSWDNRNRLTSVTDYASAADASSHATPQWTVTYTYDMFNNIVGREVVSHVVTVSSSSQHYIYDNGQIVLQLADNGAVDDRYLWAPAVDLLLAQEDANNDVDWALDDNLNSVRDWINNTGAVVAHNAYDAFGDLEAGLSTGTLNAPFGFTGVFRDDLTGFQNNRDRWYDPETARWLSQDPAGFVAGDSNLYRYVENGPTNAIDPFGLEPIGYASGGNGLGTLLALLAQNNPLARALLTHYVMATGGPYVLSEAEAISVRPDPLDVRDIPKFYELLHQLEAKAKEQGSQASGLLEGDVSAQSQSTGTLGNFTVHFVGTLTTDCQVPPRWTFDGTITFKDTYDFDPKPFGEEISGRPWYAELKVIYGYYLISGKPFEVSSVDLKARQIWTQSTVRWAGAQSPGDE
ncbi:MAG TPA: RHS repeat-associated core domain-containing protein [Pirellulales bacterium]